MQRALQLAKLAGKYTKTNPNVGAVIVQQGKVIGEGYHTAFGQAHAEVEALRVCAESDLSDATIYVTLEPCNHYGKTPPCTDAIIAAGIQKVVIGCLDPSDQMSGKSVDKLRNHGIQVEVGVCESACQDLIKPFVVHKDQKRPYVYLKQAQSSNFKVGVESTPYWITGPESRLWAHDLRGKVDAIIVGTRTVEVDNPSLTNRSGYGDQPLRVVLDRTGKVSPQSSVYQDAFPTITFSTVAAPAHGKEWVQLPTEDFHLEQILSRLFERGVCHLLVEGGPRLISSFIGEGLWDEAHILTSSKPIINQEAINAVPITGILVAEYPLGNDKYQRVFRVK